MDNLNDTIEFEPINRPVDLPHEIIMSVYEALKEKGYDPTTQMVGYLISGDPTYITNHRGARSLIRRIERDEILEKFVNFYIEQHGTKK